MENVEENVFVINFMKANIVKFMQDKNAKVSIVQNASIILGYVKNAKKVINYLINLVGKLVLLVILNTKIVVKNVYIRVNIVKIKNNA